MQNNDYIEKRNALIPEALAHADVVAGEEPKSTGTDHFNWSATWNTAFHTKMNDLAAERLGVPRVR
jgi:lysophospholipase L1-like esterase